MIKSCDQLKDAFRSGAVPTQDDFAALIDSSAQVDEVAALGKSLDDLATRTSAVEQTAQPPIKRSFEANGQWQSFNVALDTVSAYEIVAEIDKSPRQPYEALTVAIAAGGGPGVTPSVQLLVQVYSQAYWALLTLGSGAVGGLSLIPFAAWGLTNSAGVASTPALGSAINWLGNLVAGGGVATFTGAGVLVAAVVVGAASRKFRDQRAIDVAWRRTSSWYDPKATYDLALRSRIDYGSKTQKVPIVCSIRRLSE